MFNETDPSVWRQVPTRKYSMEALSTVQCPACQCDLQLYKSVSGELYMRVNSSWAPDGKAYQKVTPKDEPPKRMPKIGKHDRIHNLEVVILNLSERIFHLEKDYKRLEARLKTLEDMPCTDYDSDKTLKEFAESALKKTTKI